MNTEEKNRKKLNIIYISDLTNHTFKGPYYSIPAQINAQKKFDNILWVNLNKEYKYKKIDDIEFHKYTRITDLNISRFNSPFNKPDLVVFQSVYIVKYLYIALQLIRKNIPFIIVPRSSLTKKAQKYKRIKKMIGNLLVFRYFIKKAQAIQYLSKFELENSGLKWNSNSIIIPNGIKPQKVTKNFSDLNLDLVGVYIGRPNIYQKGLDNLIFAVLQAKDFMLKNKMMIELYLPNVKNEKIEVVKLVKKNNLFDIIKIKEGVYGLEKEKAILGADFFILTSRFEGLPMGLLEAFSYGLPALISKGTNMAYEVNKFNAGWVAESEPESIKNALYKIQNDRNLLRIKSINALMLAKLYNWDSISKKTHSIYIEILRCQA